MGNEKFVIWFIAILIAFLCIATVCAYCTAAAEPTVNADGTLTVASVQKPQPKVTVISAYYVGYYDFTSRSESAIELTDEERQLLYAVVCLEAGGEGEDMQRAVTEVIRNRLLSGIWGNTITEVIYAAHQFEVVPYLWKANPSDLTKTVVDDVFAGNVRIPPNVLYFRTNWFHQWGCKPEFRCANVYFSSGG